MKTKPIRLLLLDDNREFTQLLGLLLGKDGEFIVTEANNAREALRLLEDHSFDLMIAEILTLDMPLEALLGIVSERYPDLPFGILTRMAVPPQWKLGEVIKDTPVATKPVTMETVRKFITLVLTKTPRGPEDDFSP